MHPVFVFIPLPPQVDSGLFSALYTLEDTKIKQNKIKQDQNAPPVLMCVSMFPVEIEPPAYIAKTLIKRSLLTVCSQLIINNSCYTLPQTSCGSMDRDMLVPHTIM